MTEREEAKKLGLKRYKGGKTCKHGHVGAEKLTSCGRCIECHRITKAKRWWMKQLGRKIREIKYGYDPSDLRCRRKERGIKQPSDNPKLVALREYRKIHGRRDRTPAGEPTTLPGS